MQNIKELRKNLVENYTKTKSGDMPIATCKELANTAGKILSSCKVELQYNSLMGIKKKIDFLE